MKDGKWQKKNGTPWLVLQLVQFRSFSWPATDRNPFLCSLFLFSLFPLSFCSVPSFCFILSFNSFLVALSSLCLKPPILGLFCKDNYSQLIFLFISHAGLMFQVCFPDYGLEKGVFCGLVSTGTEGKTPITTCFPLAVQAMPCLRSNAVKQSLGCTKALPSCTALSELLPRPLAQVSYLSTERSWLGDVSKKDESCFHQLSSRLLETSA